MDHNKSRANRTLSASTELQVIKAAIDFAQLSGNGSQGGLAKALLSLCDIAKADHAFFIPIDEDLAFGEIVATDDICFSILAENLRTTKNGINLTINDLPNVARAVIQGKSFEVLDSLFIEQGILKNALTRARIGSILLLGVGDAHNLHGLMGVSCEGPVTRWPSDALLLLRLITASFTPWMESHKTANQLKITNERLDLAMESSNDGWWEWNKHTDEVFFSKRWHDLLGYGKAEGKEYLADWSPILHPDDVSESQENMQALLKREIDSFENVARMRHKRGDYRWILTRAKGLYNQADELEKLLAVQLDITERILHEAQFKREKENASVTLDAIGDGVISTDTDGVVEYLNPVAEQLTGWHMEDAMGLPIKEIFRVFHEETCEPIENPLMLSMRRKNKIKSIRPSLMVKRDGTEQFIESTAAPIRSSNDKTQIVGGVLVFHDVTESRELNRRLSYHASHDILTGLVNRTEFEKQLATTISKVDSHSHVYALCHLDIDRFKMINDTCGHAAGDLLLSQLGALFKSKIRWRDIVARIGSDNFGLICEINSMEEAQQVIEELRVAVNDFQFIWDDRSYNMTVSIGLVPITSGETTVEELLTTAESACTAAKEGGRNRVHIFKENDLDMIRRKREMQWAARITSALDEDRFEIFRQFIHPLDDNPEDKMHFELLLRMKDENGKTISPSLFIAAAERYGLIKRIDKWVIQNTFRWLVSEADERDRLAMCSINLSGQSMSDDKFLDYVIEQFEFSGLNPELICFEITETAAIASYAKATHFIETLKNLGCKFALDDFGTGHASFGYLKQFPVDYLKIDGSFVKGIVNDPIDREMVRTINQIGHLTGKKTIAEFAENAEIIRILKELGVNYAQGFGFSQPEQVNRNIA
ncbi:MAG: EAL domain-containing protein [Gammaproteobacteria bacterium]|nr:EAL domain-containing protein [Gammaproteobacteria bacterium]NNC98146.1 EAL domain-containing protein [Gammaproteobacteria bacterium]NNM14385.1 EAL domain-containing protein [Gammaproteobacteria bacterium]